MIQNQADAGQAKLSNFHDIAGCPVTSTPLLGEIVSAESGDLFGHQVVLLKMTKGARPVSVT